MKLRDIARWYRVREGYWFAPKMFGWGATPVTWQGWLLSLAFGILLIATIRCVRSDLLRIAIMAALAFGFFAIAARKTDGGWRWRWGSRD